ncbi:MAG: hypothetical protein RLY97_37 [Pseudomonadota bacterium]
MMSHNHHDHGHHHGHQHGHHHGHTQGHTTNSPAFIIAISLNLVFVVTEVAAGLYSNSMALLADAGHNLADVLTLILAWGASNLAARAPTARYTYGFKSSSILAALANAALLWVALGAILLETLRHLFTPAPVAGMMMMAVAAAGIVVNGLSAMLFARGQKDDLNLRAAFQHLLADAAVSAGVVAAGALVLWTGWRMVDPVTSLIITAIIGMGSWSLLRDSLRLGLLAVPDAIDEGDVRAFLTGQAGVAALHDLHIWPMSTTETALTAHLAMPDGAPGDGFLHDLAAELQMKFGIHHATIQIESGDGGACKLHPDAVV